MDVHNLGAFLPVWSIIPFAGLLLSIAIIPLKKAPFWERHMLKIVIFWSLAFLIPFGIGLGGKVLLFKLLETVLLDYLPFIVLLFGLFTVSGGIILKGSLAGTPPANIALLLTGTILASWIGTTGASMLLIRPLIKANQWRDKKAHVIIFFIFLVSNIGGCLTPLGDPPLFLGFLRGIPFFWPLRLLPILLLNTAILLSIFYIIDSRCYKKENGAKKWTEALRKKEPLRVEGAHNFLFILMIVGAVILSGLLPTFAAFANPVTGEARGIPIYEGIVLGYNTIIQMAIILFAAFLSVKTTKKQARNDNFFTWGPIKEVGQLFIGIFITMIPALALLTTHGPNLGLHNTAQFFWATGALSSFLDNAPTYLVFMTTAASLGTTAGVATSIGIIAPQILMAVSAGAVFMGANTYIGNAPNFMVKSIAEENQIKMPSFFGYMGWSLCILIPLFIIDTVIFF